MEISELALKMIDEYPIFGSGPGSFEALAQFELDKSFTSWQSWVHNDYLEFYLTFGKPGVGIMIALTVIIALQYIGIFWEGSAGSLKWFGLLAVVGVATHAILDFPLQVYSILTLLMLTVAILTYRSPGRIIRPSGTSRLNPSHPRQRED